MRRSFGSTTWTGTASTPTHGSATPSASTASSIRRSSSASAHADRQSLRSSSRRGDEDGGALGAIVGGAALDAPVETSGLAGEEKHAVVHALADTVLARAKIALRDPA